MGLDTVIDRHRLKRNRSSMSEQAVATTLTQVCPSATSSLGSSTVRCEYQTSRYGISAKPANGWRQAAAEPSGSSERSRGLRSCACR
jgi:hypothetical protein